MKRIRTLAKSGWGLVEVPAEPDRVINDRRYIQMLRWCETRVSQKSFKSAKNPYATMTKPGVIRIVFKDPAVATLFRLAWL